ncbi:uncharacterized protein LOC106095267 [Stomoxys calcitrans]|uniref:uncharacterized protein LOC106095267 n=1 Tax=Stomoxys calcitrans TaxID=35570 RepID=UPI0027E3704D|nr:uncharacterized protein LOC106095267 [Stomoxys calcitrans]
MICAIVLSSNKSYSQLVLLTLIYLCVPVKAKLPILFPPTAPTRVQWIAGIGIPLDNLRFEAMTSGYVLKAEYFLPSTVEQLKTKSQLPITVRKLDTPTKFEQFFVDDDALLTNATKSEDFLQHHKHVRSSYRWTVYKGLEGLATRMGLSGRDCMLKSICEAAENPFHHYNGLFGELLHILLTPSASKDELSTHSDNEYFQAESIGRSGAKCGQVFSTCARSLLEHFTDFPQLSHNIMSLIGLEISKNYTDTKTEFRRSSDCYPVVFSQVLERIMNTQSDTFLHLKEPLTDRQSGFRSKRNCSTVLIGVVEEFKQNIDDNNMVSFLVLLDQVKPLTE